MRLGDTEQRMRIGDTEQRMRLGDTEQRMRLGDTKLRLRSGDTEQRMRSGDTKLRFGSNHLGSLASVVSAASPADAFKENLSPEGGAASQKDEAHKVADSNHKDISGQSSSPSSQQKIWGRIIERRVHSFMLKMEIVEMGWIHSFMLEMEIVEMGWSIASCWKWRL
jgi:hypothetical protein